MTAARLLVTLYQRGVAFSITDANRIRWRAPAGVIGPAEIAELGAHRNALLDLLDAVEERAAIMEYDAGLTRAEAEAATWAELTSTPTIGD